MENKCLVTKLNGTVDNENLFKFGELRIKVDTDLEGKKPVINVGGFKNATVTVTGDLSIWDYQLTTNYGSSFHYESSSSQDPTSVRIKGSNGYISIINKYSMYENTKYPIGIYDTVNDNTIKSIMYWFKGVEFSTSRIGYKQSQRSGDLSELASLTNLGRININYSPNITGNLEDLVVHKDTLKVLLANGTAITGSIESLGECTLLESLTLNGVNVSGTVENFVARQRLAGRTTAQFGILDIGNTNITFNGHLVNTNTSNNFSWTENTITLNGETINA